MKPQKENATTKKEDGFQEHFKKRRENEDKKDRQELLWNLIYLLLSILIIWPIVRLLLNHFWIAIAILIVVIIYLIYKQTK